ncbi:hypothetical protein B0H19DRAFT_93505 [Mycena capillaripes]|nr:hypothetical protein B0H19DRAFT_93505 [Mycena capillaripes]
MRTVPLVSQLIGAGNTRESSPYRARSVTSVIRLKNELNRVYTSATAKTSRAGPVLIGRIKAAQIWLTCPSAFSPPSLAAAYLVSSLDQVLCALYPNRPSLTPDTWSFALAPSASTQPSSVSRTSLHRSVLAAPLCLGVRLLDRLVSSVSFRFVDAALSPWTKFPSYLPSNRCEPCPLSARHRYQCQCAGPDTAQLHSSRLACATLIQTSLEAPTCPLFWTCTREPEGRTSRGRTPFVVERVQVSFQNRPIFRLCSELKPN